MSLAREDALCTNVSKDGVVLFDAQHDRLLKLNHVAAEMLDLLQISTPKTEIIERIAQRYRVDKMRVAGDLEVLLQRIRVLGPLATPARRANSEPSGIFANSQSSFPWYGQYMRPRPPRADYLTVLRAVLGLGVFDVVLRTLSINTLCALVRRWPVKRCKAVDVATTIGRTCDAVERAGVWYARASLCLQRSAVTTCLLRNRGISARMVVGACPMPFLAHAWVEVDGVVVNDWPRVKSFYQVLDWY